MIKINLLPSNLYEAQRKVWTVVACIVVLAIVLGVSFMYKKGIDKQREDYTRQALVAEDLKRQADELITQTNAVLAAVKDIQDKIAFFDAVKVFNNQYPYLYEELAKFTYRKVIYASITPDGAVGAGPNGLEIKAYAPSLSDCGRYLLNMYRANHIFSSVKIDAVPGFPAEDAPNDGGGAPGAPQGGGGGNRTLMPNRLAGAAGMAPPQDVPNMPAPNGMSAIEEALNRSIVEGPRGFAFKVNVVLSLDMVDKLKPPVMGVGATPGTPGVPTAPGAPSLSSGTTSPAAGTPAQVMSPAPKGP